MTKPKVGRPRSEKSREAIMTATRALLNEGDSKLTIEAIAKRAGVGKPTLYRWWPTLADIVLEALLSQAEDHIITPPFTSLRATLRQFLMDSLREINAGAGTHLRFLMAQAQADEGFRERFRDHFVSKRRAVLLSIFHQAVDHGEMDATRNLELLVDLVFGAKWYRLLTGHAAMDTPFADELTDMIVRLASTAEPTDCG